MNGRSFTFGTSGNPIVQVLSLLVLGLVLIGAIVMGTVILAAVIGLAMVAAMIFAVRVWWLRWKLRHGRGTGVVGDGSGGEDREGRVIEVEYKVLSERDLERHDSDRRD